MFRVKSRRTVLLGFLMAAAAATLGLLAWPGAEPSLSQHEQLFSTFEYQPEPAVVTRDFRQSVAAIHPRVRDIGMEILHSGGNAYDAFVAAVFAEYVLAEGGSSIAGPLGVLVYDASSKKTEYLDADFNTPLDPKAIWESGDNKRPGKAILMGGAVAGLEELARRGRLGWARLLEPAIELATSGFKVSNLYAGIVNDRMETLAASAYGKRVFFRNGVPLKAGDLLIQPELASLLRNLQKYGSSYMYSGDWAHQFLKAVHDSGGQLTQADLSSYRVRWTEPWSVNYRGYEVISSSGLSYGGVWALLALKALEHADLGSLGHPSVSAPALELMIRTARRVWATDWLFDCLTVISSTPPCSLSDHAKIEKQLDTAGSSVFKDVSSRMPAVPKAQAGSHSYHVIAVDSDGNVVSGTHTIEGAAWGDGIFVEGVPLTQAGMVPWSTKPGTRRVSPLTMHFVFVREKLLFATGAISNSLVEAALQFIVNLVDYRLPLAEAATKPRFGTFPPKNSGGMEVDWSRNWISPDVSDDIVRKLNGRNIKLWNKGAVDTGLGTLVAVQQNGAEPFAAPSQIEGTTTPLPYVVDPFGFSGAPPRPRQKHGP